MHPDSWKLREGSRSDQKWRFFRSFVYAFCIRRSAVWMRWPVTNQYKLYVLNERIRCWCAYIITYTNYSPKGNQIEAERGAKHQWAVFKSIDLLKCIFSEKYQRILILESHFNPIFHSKSNSRRARQVIGVPRQRLSDISFVSHSYLSAVFTDVEMHMTCLQTSSIRQPEQNGQKHSHHNPLNYAFQSDFGLFRINLIGRWLHWRLIGSIDFEERHIERVGLKLKIRLWH